MSSFELPKNPTTSDIHRLYTHKQASVSEVVEYFISKIESGDSEIQSVVRINFEKSQEIAKKLDGELINSQNIAELLVQKPLFGIPFALKDNILVQDLPITAQSRILEGFNASYSADVYNNLEQAGGVLVAQTNMDEFAFGSSTEYSGFGQITKNPHDTTRVSGGTSGGSAAMVAAGFIPFAIGTDTGGSIRQPASFCGVYGIRPTYGSVSRYGIIASASSFDQAGPLANSLKDAHIILEVLQKKSSKDQTSVHSKAPTHGKKILGVPKQFFGNGVDDEVQQTIKKTVDTFSKTHTILEVDLPSTSQVLSVYYILQTVEAAANLERFDGVRYGKQSTGSLFYGSRADNLGHEVQKRIMLGTYTSSAGYYDAYYNKACQVREIIRREYEVVFENVDALFMPVSPFPAFKIGENTANDMSMYLADIMTVSHPISRLPALVVPLLGSKLPIGLQIVGKEFNDKLLFELASLLTNRS